MLPRLLRTFGRPPAERLRLIDLAADKRRFLREVDIFRDLTQADMADLDAATRMTTVARGRTIYH
jgi:hypothetical protein